MRLFAPLLLALFLGCVSTPAQPPSPPADTQAPTPTPAAAVDPEARARARAVLALALAQADTELRGEALVALGLSRDEGAREKLEAALKAEDGKLRFGAARGLRYLGDPASADALGEAWMKEKGWAVRRELALAAAAAGATDLVPLLREGLAHPKPELVHASAWALDALGDPAGSAALERLGSPAPTWRAKPGTERWSRKVLDAEREGDRVLAARTLAELGGAEDAARAARLLQAPEALVQLYAAALLLRGG
jgi:HEAT repeat protein